MTSWGLATNFTESYKLAALAHGYDLVPGWRVVWRKGCVCQLSRREASTRSVGLNDLVHEWLPRKEMHQGKHFICFEGSFWKQK
jgi:hypothetical protein